MSVSGNYLGGKMKPFFILIVFFAVSAQGSDVASEAYCEKNPYASSCGQSEAYCEKNPYASSCGQSEAYCEKNPYASSCS